MPHIDIDKFSDEICKSSTIDEHSANMDMEIRREDDLI